MTLVALLTRVRTDRRFAALVAAGTAAVLIAAVLVVMRTWGGGAAGLGEGDLATPRHKPDPVPAVPVALMGDCGVSTATIKALAPKARRSGRECHWISTADGKQRLQVDLDAGRPATGQISSTSDQVPGLGEQAFGAYVQDGTPGRVVFRVRNVLVEVAFDPGEPMSGERRVAAASKAAAEVIKSLPS